MKNLAKEASFLKYKTEFLPKDFGVKILNRSLLFLSYTQKTWYQVFRAFKRHARESNTASLKQGLEICF